MMRRYFHVFIVAILLGPTVASAGVLHATLTGDPRATNPDNIIVDVTINFSGGTASWVVDLNSPAHLNIKLGEFAFNIASPPYPDVQIQNISPNTDGGKQWLFSATSLGGAGAGNNGMQFSFVSELSGNGSPHTNQVNSGTNLTFDLIRLAGEWTAADFLNAPQSISNDQNLGAGQLGAHLQSLTIPGVSADSGSGIALGNYVYDDVPPGPPVTAHAPEPTSLLTFGLLAMVSLGSRRRKPV